MSIMFPPYHLFSINIIISFIIAIGILLYKFIYPKRTPNLLFLLIIISLLPVISIFRQGTYESGDLSSHTAYLINFYENLQQGIFIPIWADQYSGGYGGPIFEFLYPLPMYIASIFHFLGFSFLNSVKLFLFTSFIASGITMYLWIKYQFGKTAGFVAAVFYLFAPYHLIDLHYRVSVGEVLSYVFLPLVFLFVAKIFKSPRLIWIIAEAFSLALLAISHLMTLTSTLHLLILYIAVMFIMQKKKQFKQLIYIILSILTGLLLSCFYWLPAISEIKYTWYQWASMVQFVSLQSLLFSPTRYGLLFQGNSGEYRTVIGYAQLIIMLLLATFIIRRKFKKREQVFSIWLIFSFCIVFFLMLRQSEFIWTILAYMNNFQSTWRLLIIMAFITASAAGLLVTKISNKWLIAGLCAFAILSTILNWGNRRMIPEDKTIYPYQWLMWTEYYNEQSFNKRVLIYQGLAKSHPKHHIEILKGSAEIVELKRTITSHEYIIHAKDSVTIRENTNYYPDWTLHINNSNQYINYTNSNNPGKMEFQLNPGLYHVLFTFKDSAIRYYAKFISIVTLIIIFLSILFFSRKTLLRQYNQIKHRTIKLLR